jgi:hypothetical protein
VFTATDRACRDPRCGANPHPFNGDLEAFTHPCTGHDDPLDELPDHLFALRHGGRGGLPEGRNVVGELRESGSLRGRQGLRLGLDEALVILLPSPLGGEFFLPVLGPLPGNQAVRGFTQPIGPCGPLGLVRRPLSALLPQTVQLPALRRQAGSGFQREGQRGGFERVEAPLTHAGVDGVPGEILAVRCAVVGRQAITGITMELVGASVAHVHAASTLPAHEYPCQ